MKIVVLAGGLSTERHVSLVSGTCACRALREAGCTVRITEVLAVGITDRPGGLGRADRKSVV